MRAFDSVLVYSWVVLVVMQDDVVDVYPIIKLCSN